MSPSQYPHQYNLRGRKLVLRQDEHYNVHQYCTQQLLVYSYS